MLTKETKFDDDCSLIFDQGFMEAISTGADINCEISVEYQYKDSSFYDH